MVKPKRATARQRVEKKIEKEQNQLTDQSLTKKKPEDVATIVSTAKTVSKWYVGWNTTGLPQ